MSKLPTHSSCKGVNAELINWLRNYEFIDLVLEDKSDIDNLIVPAICSGEHRDRVVHSKELLKKLWYRYPVLGPYPLLEILFDLEFDAKFHDRYRDHGSHQLKVYLLDLYFFDNVPLIKAEILKELDLDDTVKCIKEFHLRWLIAAIYHDIGYIIENEQTSDLTDGIWETTKLAINEALRIPLSFIPKFNKRITKEKENKIIQNNKIFRPSVDFPVDLEREDDIDYLVLLREYSLKAELGILTEKSLSPLRAYYQFALITRAKDNRPRFRDHGIASALLLIKIWTSYKEYVAILARLSKEQLLNNNINDLITLSLELDAFDDTIIASASAISLHNLNKDIWNLSEAIKHDLTLDDYGLRLETNGKSSTPLGFLLGLVDSIQCWDRPMYRNPDKRDEYITDEDMVMSANKGKIYISFAEDEQYKDPKKSSESFYSRLLQGIYSYIDKKSVDKILDCKFTATEVGEIDGEIDEASIEDFSKVVVSKIDYSKPTSLNDFITMIRCYEPWLVGAVNFDEDLHFSAFYLYICYRYPL